MPAVDGLRAVAVLMVFVVHTYAEYMPGGWIGVDIFFVISGFLITGLLLREFELTGKVSVSQFYIRRIFRIFPALVVCVTAVALLLPWTLHGPDDLAHLNVAAALLGFMNWIRALSPATGGSIGHTWSLGIEEQFYLIWVVVIVLTPRKSTILVLAATGLVAMAAWRAGLAYSGASVARLYNGLDTHGDGLLVGAALAALPRKLPSSLVRLWPIPAAFLALAALTVSEKLPIVAYGGLTVISLACGWIVYAAAVGSAGLQSLGGPLPVWLGKRSYSFYLWHMPIIGALPALGLSRSMWVLPALALSVLAAALSYSFVERPFLALKDRVNPAAHAPKRRQAI